MAFIHNVYIRLKDVMSRMAGDGDTPIGQPTWVSRRTFASALFGPLAVRFEQAHAFHNKSIGSSFPSIPAVQESVVEDSVEYIVTAGYYEPGDGGGAVYIRASSPPVWSGGQVASANGVWFWLSEIEPNVKMFGAKGDGVADDTISIQNCIDYAMYQSPPRGRVLVFPGKYKISDTIHLGYGETFKSIVFEGHMYKYGGGDAFGGSTILAMFSDRPCINVQGGRGTAIRGLSLLGLNQSWIQNAGLGELSARREDLDPEAWVDPSISPTAVSRYAPYAGITIDGYSGFMPWVAYPPVKYPKFLGPTSQYEKRFSSNVLIENCEIRGFVVGVSIQPCDADGNSDYTKVRRTEISYCQYAVSIGNGQSRLVHIADSGFNIVHTGIVTTVHGRRIGKPSILVTSTEIGNCIRWVSIPNLSYGGGPKLDGCYGEGVYSIGSIGTNSVGQHPILFANCEFNFQSQMSRGAPVWTLEVNGSAQTRFEGCAFKGAAGRFCFGPAPAHCFSMANCLVETRSARELFEKFALNATCGITFGRLTTSVIDFNVVPIATWNLDTGTQLDQTKFTKSNSGIRSQGLCVYSRKALAASSPGDPGFDVALAVSAILNKRRLAFKVVGREVTFDSGWSDWQFAQYGFEVGDVVYDDETHVLYYVRSRSGSIVTMQAQTGFDGRGNLRQEIARGGNLYSLNCRLYSPAYPLYATMIAASSALVNAARDDGGGGAWLESNIAGGDWLYVRSDVDHFIAPNGAQILERDGVSNSITVVGKFNRSESRKRFGVFIRTPPNSWSP